MKKYLGLIVLFFAFSLNAQTLSNKFDIKQYAEKQTNNIKTALDLSDEQADMVYMAALNKARSIKKYILLYETQGKAANKTLKQVVKEVEGSAEKGSGFEDEMHRILGQEKFEAYLKKFK